MNVLYVSYDGALDPLGQSQIVTYLRGLASKGVSITLLSFEKPERERLTATRASLDTRLRDSGIEWRSLKYHRRPRVPATLWDVVQGARTIVEEMLRTGARIVHCRGDVAMAMARIANVRRTARLLYDVRGFFSAERIEGGSWPEGGILDRTVRWIEAGNLREADAVVVLTRRAKSELSRRRQDCVPVVIPTCVDLATYRPRSPDVPPEHGLSYSGSLGTWYMAREMVDFARIATAWIPGMPLFLTPDRRAAVDAGVTEDWASLETVSSGEVASRLRMARASFFFIRPTPGKRASCPTKLGESLACGLPVATNRGIGDLDDLFQARPDIGVLVDDFSPAAYERAARQLARLVEDPETASRCREVAEKQLALEIGVSAYYEIYRGLSA